MGYKWYLAKSKLKTSIDIAEWNWYEMIIQNSRVGELPKMKKDAQGEMEEIYFEEYI